MSTPMSVIPPVGLYPRIARACPSDTARRYGAVRLSHMYVGGHRMAWLAMDRMYRETGRNGAAIKRGDDSR